MRRRGFTNPPKVETFYLRISIGKKSYFFERTRKGYVLGPCDANDHLTVGLKDGDEGELVQVHRKVNGLEVWRYTQGLMLEELRDYWDTHCERIDLSVLLQPQTYVVSLHRLQVLYNLFMNVLVSGVWLFGRFFAKIGITWVNDRTVIVDLDVNKDRIVHFMKSLKSPLLILSRILTSLSPNVYYAMGKQLSKILLINKRKLRKLDDDIGILLSKERMGIILSNEENRLSYLSGSSILELYKRIESGLPFGKLHKVFDGSSGGLSMKLKVPQNATLGTKGQSLDRYRWKE